MPQGILRQFLIMYNLTTNNVFYINLRQPSLTQGLPPLTNEERKITKPLNTSGSQILGRAFQPNNRLVPIKSMREEKVKVLNSEQEEYVLKEDAAVQTDRFIY